LRPDRYVAELARIVRAAGGLIEENCRLSGVDLESGAVLKVQCQNGERRARDYVLALGAWSFEWARPLGLDLPIQPGKGYSITYSRPQCAPRRPLVLKERSVCVTAWGSGFRLGSTMEFSGYDGRLNPVRLAALTRAAREYLREPNDGIEQERWCGWRPMSCDDSPLIGPSPRQRNLWIATGHGMLGVSMSAATGVLIADLICGRPPLLDPTPYRPARFAQ
jgi:D-amino-acid dehydrogenase